MLDTLYYKDTYVSTTPYYHEEISGVPPGEPGEPFAYSIVCDGFLSIALCLCLMMTIIMGSNSWRFTKFQLRNLFRTPRENSIQMRETSDEMQYQAWFILQAIFMMGILTFSVTLSHLDDFLPYNQYITLAIHCGIFAIYYTVKEILYSCVNMVYFSKNQRHMFNVSRLFLMAVYGAFLLPVTLIHLYLDLDPKTTLYVVLTVLSVSVILRFYRVWNIFFQKNGNLLKFFLYLCTLEIVPFALLIGILLLTAHILKINI